MKRWCIGLLLRRLKFSTIFLYRSVSLDILWPPYKILRRKKLKDDYELGHCAWLISYPCIPYIYVCMLLNLSLVVLTTYFKIIHYYLIYLPLIRKMHVIIGPPSVHPSILLSLFHLTPLAHDKGVRLRRFPGNCARRKLPKGSTL